MEDAFDAAEKAFGRFFGEKLRPEAERIVTRRKRFFKWSILAAAGAYAVFFLLALKFLSPHAAFFGEHDSSAYWTLLFLFPASMAVVCFTLVYILLLRAMTLRFRDCLIQRTAEFIGPTLVHRHDRRADESDLRRTLLFGGLSRPRTGRDCFFARREDSATEIRAFRASRNEDGKKTAVFGVCLSVRRERAFPAPFIVLPRSAPANAPEMAKIMAEAGIPPAGELESLDIPESDLRLFTQSGGLDAGRRALTAVLTPGFLASCRGRKLEPGLSCAGNRLATTLSGTRKGGDWPDIFDSLDLVLCREFCLEAVMCAKAAEEAERLLDASRLETDAGADEPKRENR